MATRHVTYHFDWGFATYDRDNEQELINEVEAQAQYIEKFNVTIPDRELIDTPSTILEVVDGELIIIPSELN